MKLSVIVPMFNCEDFLDRCLSSLLHQDIELAEYEIILINDGSTDGTLAEVKKFTDLYNNIFLFNQENNGQSVARNFGIQKAKGKYIWFVDSDDYVAHNVLDLLLETAERNDLDILMFKLMKTDKLDIYKSSNISSFEKNTEIKVNNGLLHIAENNYNEGPCGYLIKNAYLKKSGIHFIEGRFMEDMIFTAELLLKAERLAYLPVDVYRYVFNPNSTWNSVNPKHNRKVAMDLEFMAYKFQELIDTINQDKHPLTINRLNSKKNGHIKNIFKRLLQSDLSISEIIKFHKRLEKNKLIPVKSGTSMNKKSILIKTFNYLPLFIIYVTSFKLFEKNINHYINSKLRKRHLKKYFESW